MTQAVASYEERWNNMSDAEKIYELDHNGSGHADEQLRKAGWTAVPAVEFDGVVYAILYGDVPHPGRNTQEVINVTEFNRGGESAFQILVSKARRSSHTAGNVWIKECEFGIAVLTVYNGVELEEYIDPFTAVLTYEITPPKPASIRKTARELDEQLQEFGPRI